MIYQKDENKIINNNQIIIESNQRDENKKINNRLYNVNTSSYESIVFNKTQEAINLLDLLDKSINSISSNIIRNYLIRNVVYKFDKRILEVQVNQKHLLLSFHKEAKIFDVNNKLYNRKGYKNNAICYSMVIDNKESCEYAIKIIDSFYQYLVNPKEKITDRLFDIMKLKITCLSETVGTHNTNKGLMFRDQRNFALISKKNYGVYIKVLNVKNDGNVLDVVTRKAYEPLCLSYKIQNEEDIDIVLPFIYESYKMNKINPVDLKNSFYQYYYVTE